MTRAPTGAAAPDAMTRIESYLLRQLLWPTAAATGALLAVALLSQTLTYLYIVVSHRQGLGVFAEVVLLGLPSTVTTVLPIALFVAALYALNRLHTEHEIVVCFAGGLSRWRVAAPAMRLAVAAALLALAVNLFVTPWCARRMRTELFRVRTDLVASLINEGRFTEPSPGLTVYAQSLDSGGALKNVFIHESQGAHASTFSAKRGVITRQATPTGVDRPVLVLRNGSNEQFNERRVLTQTLFSEYVFDLTPFVKAEEQLVYKISDRWLHELVYPDKRGVWERRNRKKFLAEAHSRLSAPLYNIALMLIALHAVFGGPFSRVGYGRRIAVACVAALAVRVVGFGVQAACDGAPALNVLQYLVPLAPIAWVSWRLFGRRGAARRARGFLPPAPAMDGAA